MGMTQKKNNMLFKGILVGSRSYNNISLDLLRSSIIRYIIYGNCDKAIWCAIEFYLFKNIECIPVITNLINKISCLLVEHKGISHIDLLYSVMTDLETKLSSDVET